MTLASEPPDATTDCFPVQYCNEFGRGCTVLGNSSPDDSIDDQAIRGFLDTDGYFWVTITSYAWNSSGVPVPHWVTIYKSKSVVDCDEIKAATEDGWSPVGPSSTDWMELVCDGLAVGWDSGSTEGRCDGSDEPAVDLAGAVPTLTFHRARGSCCEVISDPCNPPGDGDCSPDVIGSPCDNCIQCEDFIAPPAMLIEIEHNETTPGFESFMMNDLDGAYVAYGGECLREILGIPVGPQNCGWRSPCYPKTFRNQLGETVTEWVRCQVDLELDPLTPGDYFVILTIEALRQVDIDSQGFCDDDQPNCRHSFTYTKRFSLGGGALKPDCMTLDVSMIPVETWCYRLLCSDSYTCYGPAYAPPFDVLPPGLSPTVRIRALT